MILDFASCLLLYLENIIMANYNFLYKVNRTAGSIIFEYLLLKDDSSDFIHFGNKIGGYDFGRDYDKNETTSSVVKYISEIEDLLNGVKNACLNLLPNSSNIYDVLKIKSLKRSVNFKLTDNRNDVSIIISRETLVEMLHKFKLILSEVNSLIG